MAVVIRIARGQVVTTTLPPVAHNLAAMAVRGLIVVPRTPIRSIVTLVQECGTIAVVVLAAHRNNAPMVLVKNRQPRFAARELPAVPAAANAALVLKLVTPAEAVGAARQVVLPKHKIILPARAAVTAVLKHVVVRLLAAAVVVEAGALVPGKNLFVLTPLSPKVAVTAVRKAALAIVAAVAEAGVLAREKNHLALITAILDPAVTAGRGTARVIRVAVAEAGALARVKVVLPAIIPTPKRVVMAVPKPVLAIRVTVVAVGVLAKANVRPQVLPSLNLVATVARKAVPAPLVAVVAAAGARVAASGFVRPERCSINLARVAARKRGLAAAMDVAGVRMAAA